MTVANGDSLSDRSGLIWVTGYSGAGKTTVSRQVEGLLRRRGARTILLDGDDLRRIFAGRWGYSPADRIELAKVYFHLCSHLVSQGFVVVIGAVAMYDEARAWVRANIPGTLVAYLHVPREVRHARDAGTKGVYRSGADLELGYDEPTDADLRVENHGSKTPQDSAEAIVERFLLSDLREPDRGKSEYWDAYYKTAEVFESPSPFALEAVARLSPRSRVLEVGCGDGRDAVHLSEAGHPVVALDASLAAIELCRRAHPGSPVDFVEGTLSDHASSWLGRFDVLYSRFVVHAMTESEEVAMWRESRRVLRPGGSLMVECRSIRDPLAQMGEVLSPTERIAGHYRRFIVLADLRSRMEDAGLVIDEVLESTGLADNGAEDPVVIRVFARNG